MKNKFIQTAVFVILIVLSPWFWVISKNYKELRNTKLELIDINSDRYLTQINFYQSEANKKGLGIIGKLLVNKITFRVKEYSVRFIESYDLNYLFLEGDLDYKKSTRSNGPLYFSLFPIIIFGFINLYKQKNKLYLFIYFLPVISINFQQHFETLSRLPFIIGLTYIASVGTVKLYSLKKAKTVRTIYLFVLLFDILRFFHYFYFHYPSLI